MIVETNRRQNDIRRDLMVESEVFVNVGSRYLSGCDRTDDGRRTSHAVTTCEDAFIVRDI